MSRLDLRKFCAALCVTVILGAAAAPPSSAAPAQTAVGVKVPANQRFVLPNGLTIVLVPKKAVVENVHSQIGQGRSDTARPIGARVAPT